MAPIQFATNIYDRNHNLNIQGITNYKIGKTYYSEAPRTGRPVWQTGRKNVRILNRPDFERPGCNHMSGFRMSK